MMKKGIRILAIEDSPYKRGDERALIIGVIGREGIIEGVLSSSVAVDGTDSTQQILKMIRASRFSSQIALLALNGITVAGLNLINIAELGRKLSIPVLAITRKRPRPAMLAQAMRKWSPEYENNSEVMKEIKRAITVRKSGGYYVQSVEMENGSIDRFAKPAAELLRLSHLIASGVVKGESKGRL